MILESWKRMNSPMRGLTWTRKEHGAVSQESLVLTSSFLKWSLYKSKRVGQGDRNTSQAQMGHIFLRVLRLSKG